MIHANEAVIGRYFNREIHSPRGLAYDPFFRLDEEMMGRLFGDSNDIALQDLSPIPLTPEILEACGFEDDKDFGGMVQHPHLKCRWVTNKFLFNDEKLDTPFLRFDSTGRPPYTCTDVYFLHQLQNLYLALTGTELTITF